MNTLNDQKTKSIRIGIDIRSAAQRGGVREYLCNTIPRVTSKMPCRFYLFSNTRFDQETMQLFSQKNTTIIVVPLPKPLLLFYDWIILPFLCKKLTIDLFHGPKSALSPFYRWLGIKTVVTIHDIIPIKYPQTSAKGDLIYWRIQLPIAYRFADEIITISHHSLKEMRDYFYPRDGVSVIYLDGSAFPNKQNRTQQLDRINRKYSLPARYILAVGTLQPRKNYGNLIEAFDQAAVPNLKLVIVGRYGWKCQALFALVRRCKLENKVIVLTDVDSNDLPIIYYQATLFAFLSLYEGFGLPLIEAARYAIPILAANSSCLPEIGGKGCLYVDPKDINQIARGIRQLATDLDLRQTLLAEAEINQKRFSWQKTANQTVEIYKKMITP